MKPNPHSIGIESLENRCLLSTVVSIGSLQDTAYRQTAQDGIIVVARRGDLSEDLTVPLIVGGTAANGTEYGRVGNRVVIPAGVRSVALKIRPAYPGPAGQSNYMSVAVGDIAGVRFGAREAFVDILDNPLSQRPLRVQTGSISGVSVPQGTTAVSAAQRTGLTTTPAVPTSPATPTTPDSPIPGSRVPSSVRFPTLNADGSVSFVNVPVDLTPNLGSRPIIGGTAVTGGISVPAIGTNIGGSGIGGRGSTIPGLIDSSGMADTPVPLPSALPRGDLRTDARFGDVLIQG